MEAADEAEESFKGPDDGSFHSFVNTCLIYTLKNNLKPLILLQEP
ncbi:MAG TPA: hypothetical protein OIM03_07605 [Veillonellaceae bacterium]|nr:hypothetical protein [Veillonellaceae bacterium]